MLIQIVVEVPQVELLCANKYGKFYRTSEGYHINGNKPKFIELLKRDLHSPNIEDEWNARFILSLMEELDEV